MLDTLSPSYGLRLFSLVGMFSHSPYLVYGLRLSWVIIGPSSFISEKITKSV